MNTKKNFTEKTAARLAAIQALYQMDIAETALETIIREFTQHRLAADSDASYFETILRGIVEEQMMIDQRIEVRLEKKWRLSRLDSTLRAILRCGVYELLFHKTIAYQVLVSDYTDIAYRFFNAKESGMVNALLDRVAQDINKA